MELKCRTQYWMGWLEPPTLKIIDNGNWVGEIIVGKNVNGHPYLRKEGDIDYKSPEFINLLISAIKSVDEEDKEEDILRWTSHFLEYLYYLPTITEEKINRRNRLIKSLRQALKK